MKRVAASLALFLIFNCTLLSQNFFDDFGSYTAGEQLVVQNPVDWTTWSNSPGSSEDPYIVDNGGNVVEITGTNDLIHIIDNYTSGIYSIRFDIYIPEGADGYFNTLHDFAGTASQWGMQVFFGFNNLGIGSIDGGGQNAASFNFEYDTWQMVKVLVDLDNDWAEFYLNDELIHGWVWSSGVFGTSNLNQLGGSNFFAWYEGINGNPLYYIDNYCVDFEGIIQPPAPEYLSWYFYYYDIVLEWQWSGTNETWGNAYQQNKGKAFDGFNVWRSLNNMNEWVLVATGIMENTYTHVEPEYGVHFCYVTAVVDGIESEPSNIVFYGLYGIEEYLQNAIWLYPNPANDIVNIHSDYNILNVNIYNIAGQAISEETVDGKFFQMNTSSFNAGIYLFQITTDEGVVSKRVVIE
ncbi:MAG: T9SS type A sorting domain-containing protein [Bacteroidales bacterium]|nr:T9SS type A sorting domain-containing protein [Bacteroidales bacterium]